MHGIKFKRTANIFKPLSIKFLASALDTNVQNIETKFQLLSPEDSAITP